MLNAIETFFAFQKAKNRELKLKMIQKDKYIDVEALLQKSAISISIRL